MSSVCHTTHVGANSRGAGCDTWPQAEPTDPADLAWNCWFNGVDFFINFSTPHHVKRLSRNLGRAFTMVVQSRASFDTLPGSGLKARATIRSRISRYDAVGISPCLGTHGSAPELPQFFLEDDNTAHCPILAADDWSAAGDADGPG
jgi:FPC/CPF motif-containing protein YcgG